MKSKEKIPLQEEPIVWEKSLQELKDEIICAQTQKISFRCENCSAQVVDLARNLKKRSSLLCKKCSTKLTHIRNYGSLENWKKVSKEKYEKTSQERYGVSNPFSSKEVKEKIKKTNLEKYGVEFSSQAECVKQKTRENNLAKYGCSSASQTEESKKKRAQTNLEKYGTSNPLASKEIREKVKKTNLKKYGVENASSNLEIQEKRRQTNLQKFGADSFFASQEFKARLEEYNLQNYGVKSTFQREDVRAKIRETCLEKYGVEFSSQAEEVKERVKKNNLEKYGVEYPLQLPEVREKQRNTNLQKFGCESPLSNRGVRERIKRTNLERYGCEVPTMSFEVKEKTQLTNLQKYGVPYVLQAEGVKEKIKETNLERYGFAIPTMSPEIQEKTQLTNLQKYGVPFLMQSPEMRERSRKTNLEKYGVEFSTQAEEVKEKARQAFLKKYGVNHPFKSPKIREEIKQIFLEKYGVDHPSKSPEVRAKIFAKKGMTTPEKTLFEFFTNRGIDFKFQYDCEVDGFRKNFDFALFSNGALNTLIEVDGEYYHGMLSDFDGKTVNGVDDDRFLRVPENVKFLAIDSGKVKQSFDLILSTLEIDYEAWIREVISSLPEDFPYPQYSEKRLKKDFEKLCKYSSYNSKQQLAMSSVRHFHKSIYTARVGHSPSPLEAWKDKDLLEKCVRNRFIYSSSLSSQAIANGFNVCKLAPKVSVFSPSRAKYLVNKYLADCSEVFDPFSGFSGRLLGTCSLGKKYIGQDLNEFHVKESQEIIDFHNLGSSASVKVADILEDAPSSHECLFTCPPYGSKEVWGDEEVFKTCDEWIEICLQKYSCKKHLFVVDETSKYKDFVVEKLSNRSHWGETFESVVLINSPM